MAYRNKKHNPNEPAATPTLTPRLSGLCFEQDDCDTIIIPWHYLHSVQMKYLIVDAEFKSQFDHFPFKRITLNGLRNYDIFQSLRRRSRLRNFKKSGFQWSCISEWKRSGLFVVLALFTLFAGPMFAVKFFSVDWQTAFVGLDAAQQTYFHAIAYFCGYGLIAMFLGISFLCIWSVRHHLRNYLEADRIDRVLLDDSMLTFLYLSKKELRIHLSDISKISRTGVVWINEGKIQKLSFRPADIVKWASFALSLQDEIDRQEKKKNRVYVKWPTVFRIVFWFIILGITFLCLDFAAIFMQKGWIRLFFPIIPLWIFHEIGIQDHLMDYFLYSTRRKLGIGRQRSPRPFATAKLNTK